MTKITVSLSATGVLYHITSLTKAANIVVTNRFELKPSDGTEAEELLSKSSYYLSTTRSKVGSYTRNQLWSYSVIFVLDGSRLSHRYKIRPSDYWETNKSTPQERLERRDRYESEDRVLSPRPTIEKALSYVTAIHAHLNDKVMLLRTLKKSALLHKIPIWFYNEKADLMLLNTKKAVPFVATPFVRPVAGSSTGVLEYMYKYKIRKNSISPWTELWLKPIPKGVEPYEVSKTLSKDASRRHASIRYSDAPAVLGADLHNEKVTPYGDVTKGREALDKLVGIMRNLKVDPKGFIALLVDKWYPSLPKTF